MRRWMILIPGLLALGACQSFPTPPGYLPLEATGEVVHQAVAPNGNRIEVREHDNREEGTAEYWAEAIQRELVEGRGYRLVEERPLPRGQEMLFATEHQLREYLYLVAIFPRETGWIIPLGDCIRVVEAGGEKAALEADLPALREMLQEMD